VPCLTPSSGVEIRREIAGAGEGGEGCKLELAVVVFT
jgi:hypothetical protein